MVRRHLALSIALASIFSLVLGGLAYAALTPDGKVTACVTADGFVRSATFKNKCPYKTTPVLLDRVGRPVADAASRRWRRPSSGCRPILRIEPSRPLSKPVQYRHLTWN